MIKFNYVVDNQLDSEQKYSNWVKKVVHAEKKELGELSYIFCSDSYLLKINNQYLKHNTYTDIITFDYSEGDCISGDIFISIDRVKENATSFAVEFDEELRRVMIHGVLHLIGYGDKSVAEKEVMRLKEDDTMKLFHVEQDS